MESFKIYIRHFRFLPIVHCLSPIAYCLLPITSFSQAPTVQTSADKNAILIGEQVKVTVKANFHPGLYNIHWLTVPDSIPHFEVIELSKADTITYKDNSNAIEQTITFTSFDSGKWTIPAFPVNFDPLSGDTWFKLLTDPVPVNVMYSPPDSTNELRDIKPIMEVSVFDYFWYYISAGILLLLIIIYFIGRYLNKRKQRPANKLATRLSPYEEAMEELKKLDQCNLQDAADIKTYHSRLSEIFKRYLGRKESKDMSNQTTGELLIQVTDKFSREGISALALSLRLSDAVKFAKYLPTMTESGESKDKIKETISLMEQNIKPITP